MPARGAYVLGTDLNCPEARWSAVSTSLGGTSPPLAAPRPGRALQTRRPSIFLDSVVQLVGRSRIGHGRRSRRRHHKSPGVARICSPARLLGSLKLIGLPRYTDARWRAPFGRQNEGSLHGGEHKNKSTAFPESLKGNSCPPAVLITNAPCRKVMTRVAQVVLNCDPIKSVSRVVSSILRFANHNAPTIAAGINRRGEQPWHWAFPKLRSTSVALSRACCARSKTEEYQRCGTMRGTGSSSRLSCFVLLSPLRPHHCNRMSSNLLAR